MRTIAVFVVAAGLSLGAAGQTTPSAVDVAKRLQTHYDTVRDFKADFTETYRGALLPQTSVERGEVQIKKPNRMRWRYTSGDRRELIADGKQVYDYRADDRVVFVSPMPEGDDGSTALLFLAGRGNLTRDFTPSLETNQPADEWHLKLTPKTKQADFATLTLHVDRRTMALRGLVKVDDQGSTWTFRFPKLQENVGLNDRAFVFNSPPGVEVIR